MSHEYISNMETSFKSRLRAFVTQSFDDNESVPGLVSVGDDGDFEEEDVPDLIDISDLQIEENNSLDGDEDDAFQNCKEIRLAAVQGLEEYFEKFWHQVVESADLYEPRCIVLVSRWPMYTLFETILREILMVVRKKLPLPVPLERGIMHCVSEVPEPPPGKYRVRFKLHEKQKEFFCCSRPPLNRLPLLNVPLRPLFECLGANNLLTLFTSTILEYKIVFVSDHLDLLSTVSTGLQALLFPLWWQNPFIPVLPNHPEMMEIIHAPVAIMVGVHRSQVGPHFPRDSVVYVDLDKNIVELPLNERQMPQPPGNCINRLWGCLKQQVYDKETKRPLPKRSQTAPTPGASPYLSGSERRYSRKRRATRSSVGAPIGQWKESGLVTDFLEENINREKWFLGNAPTEVFNNEVRKSFLEFFVYLIGDYRKYMGGFESGLDELIDRETFIREHQESSTCSEFLDQFVSTQMMQMFFEDRVFAAERNFEIMLFDGWIDYLGVTRNEQNTILSTGSQVEGTSDNSGSNNLDFQNQSSFLKDTSQADRQNYDVPAPNAEKEYNGAGPFKVNTMNFPAVMSWRGLPKPLFVPSLMRVRRGSQALGDTNQVTHVLESVHLNFYTKQRLFKSRFRFAKQHANAGLNDVENLVTMLQGIYDELISYQASLLKLQDTNDGKRYFDISLEKNAFMRDTIWSAFLHEATSFVSLVGDMADEIETKVCSPLREVIRQLKNQNSILTESEEAHMKKIIARKEAMEFAKSKRQKVTEEYEEVEALFKRMQEMLQRQNLEKARAHHHTRRWASPGTGSTSGKHRTSGGATPDSLFSLSSPGFHVDSAASGTSPVWGTVSGKGTESPAGSVRSKVGFACSPTSDHTRNSDNVSDAGTDSSDDGTSLDRDWFRDSDPEEDVRDAGDGQDLFNDIDGEDASTTDESSRRESGGDLPPPVVVQFSQGNSFSESTPSEVSSVDPSTTYTAKLKKGSRGSTKFAVNAVNNVAKAGSGKIRRASENLGLNGLLLGSGDDSLYSARSATLSHNIVLNDSYTPMSIYNIQESQIVTNNDLTKISDRKVLASRNLESAGLEFSQEVASLTRELQNFTNANTDMLRDFHDNEVKRIKKVKELLKVFLDIMSHFLGDRRAQLLGRLKSGLKAPELWRSEVSRKYPNPDKLPNAEILDPEDDKGRELVYDIWLEWMKSLSEFYKSLVTYTDGRQTATKRLTSRVAEIANNMQVGRVSRTASKKPTSTLQNALLEVKDSLVVIASEMSSSLDVLNEYVVTPSSLLRLELKDCATEKEELRLDMQRSLNAAVQIAKKTEVLLQTKSEQKDPLIQELVRIQQDVREAAMKQEMTNEDNEPDETEGIVKQQQSTITSTTSTASDQSDQADRHRFRGAVKNVLKASDEERLTRTQKRQEKLAKRIAQVAAEQEDLQIKTDIAFQDMKRETDSYRGKIRVAFEELQSVEEERTLRSIDLLRKYVDLYDQNVEKVVAAIDSRRVAVDEVNPDADLKKHEELDNRTRKYLHNALDPFARASSLNESMDDSLLSGKNLENGEDTNRAPDSTLSTDDGNRGGSMRKRFESNTENNNGEDRLTFARHMWGDLPAILLRFKTVIFRLRTLQKYSSGYESLQRKSCKEFEKMSSQLAIAPLDVLFQRREMDPFDDLYTKTYISLESDFTLYMTLASTCRNISTRARTAKKTLRHKMLVHVRKKRKYDAELQHAKEKLEKAKELAKRCALETAQHERELAKNKFLHRADRERMEKQVFRMRNLTEVANNRLTEAKDSFETKKIVNNNCFSQLLEQMQKTYTESITCCSEYLHDFVTNIQLDLATHATEMQFLDKPPSALENTEEPIFFDGDVDAVLDLAVMDTDGFFDITVDSDSSDDLHVSSRNSASDKDSSLSAATTRARSKGEKGVAAIRTLTQEHSTIHKLAKLLHSEHDRRILFRCSPAGERPARYEEIEKVILHSKLICESLLDVLPHRRAVVKTMLTGAINLLDTHPFLELAAGDLETIRDPGKNGQGANNKFRKFTKKIARVLHIEKEATTTSAPNSHETNGSEKDESETNTQAGDALDSHVENQEKYAHPGADESHEMLDSIDDVNGSHQDMLQGLTSEEVATLDEKEVIDLEGTDFIETLEPKGTASALQSLLNGELHREGRTEVNTLVDAITKILALWKEHLVNSRNCTDSSDDMMIKGLRDMAMTCRTTLSEIRAIKQKVTSQGNSCRSILKKANERVIECQKVLEDFQHKDFHKNLLTMEDATARKKRKVTAANRRFENARTAVQAAEDRYADHGRFQRKQAARVMRLYNALERHQYSFLCSLYAGLVFWSKRHCEKLGKIKEESIQILKTIDIHTDVHNFIEAKRSGFPLPTDL
mmetsp:Transcript_11109/g.23836  ORF Transcript_11109/g.23836 Transcript_11109/m.23836 type:complete len:2361 (-) Transcript_11109:1083-8165(-)